MTEGVVEGGTNMPREFERMGGGKVLEVMNQGRGRGKRGREEGRERDEITTLVFSFGIYHATSILEHPLLH